MVLLILIIVLIALSAVLYRMGGAGLEGRLMYPWLPEWAFDTKARDIGCGLCAVGLVFALGLTAGVSWYYLLAASFVAIVAQLGALSTYWDSIPFNKGKDNFYMHGAFCGLALFPFALVCPEITWLDTVIRVVVCAVGMGLWSYLTDHVWRPRRSDIVSEMGRGFVHAASVGVFLVYV